MILYKPIIFIGFPRSGTSVISEIIFQHEHLAWPSNYQTKFPKTAVPNLLRPVLDNPVWRINGQKKQLNKVSWYNNYVFKPSEAYGFWQYLCGSDIDFPKDFLLHTYASNERIQFIRTRFEKLVRYQMRKRLAFKITGPGRIGYLRSVFPDAVFIDIIRDPFATIRSLMKVPFWTDKKDFLYWKGAYTLQEKEAADTYKDRPDILAAIQYKKIRDTIEEERRRYNVQYHSFHYEDFVNRPDEFIGNILKISELSDSRYISQYLKTNKIFNRNKGSEYFFSEEEISLIESFLK